MKQRNELLHAMTDEVAIAGAARQLSAGAGAVARGARARRSASTAQVRLMRELERAQRLDRAIELLPDDEALASARDAAPQA